MLKILVSGAAGFIGSHLVDALLAQGHEVEGIDNLFTGRMANLDAALAHPSFHFIRHDVCEPFHGDAYDRIYHLACPASPIHYQRNPARTIKTGLFGTIHMLELAREVRARALLASTSEIYGDPAVHPQPETYLGNVNSYGPRACYDEAKRAGEAAFWSYQHQHGVETRIARIHNTYGPRMAVGDGRMISNFCVQILQDQPVTIYGDGTQTRSLCYVDDTVRGLLAVMEADLRLPVNIGNPQELAIQDTAYEIAALAQKSIRIGWRPLPADDPRRRCPDITRAKILGWTPQVEPAIGLARTLAYFQRALNL